MYDRLEYLDSLGCALRCRFRDVELELVLERVIRTGVMTIRPDSADCSEGPTGVTVLRVAHEGRSCGRDSRRCVCARMDASRSSLGDQERAAGFMAVDRALHSGWVQYAASYF